MIIKLSLAVPAVLALAACAGTADRGGAMAFSQSMLPAGMQVPAGHRVAMETVGVGQITYECRVRQDAAGQFAWAFAGPDARLLDRSGRQVGRYYGPPATWEAADGSRVTGKQLAVSPGGAGNIPLQFVQADPAMGSGAMQGVSYIQRVATQGGVAPAKPCDAARAGSKEVVRYQADYIFWKPA
ncbi:MAG: DUF3455 domain-containing protein [Burkholderiaceae bacterium]